MQNGEVLLLAGFAWALQSAGFSGVVAAALPAPFPVLDPLHNLAGGQLLKVFLAIQKVFLIVTIRTIGLGLVGGL